MPTKGQYKISYLIFNYTNLRKRLNKMLEHISDFLFVNTESKFTRFFPEESKSGVSQ